MRVVIKCEPEALAKLIAVCGQPTKVGQHTEPIEDFALRHKKAAIDDPQQANPKGHVGDNTKPPADIGRLFAGNPDGLQAYLTATTANMSPQTTYAAGVATEQNVMVLDYDAPDAEAAKIEAAAKAVPGFISVAQFGG